MPFTMTRDATSIYVKQWGEGRPVVLVHGWPLSADTWDPVGLALAQNGYRAIAYDRRGFGRSDQPWGGYDYDTLSDDLADVMKACNVTENATLVGFSMGGGEVARYMSRHGGRGLVSAALVSSIVPFLARTSDNPHGVPQSVLDEMGDGIRTDRADFIQSFIEDFYGIGMLSSPVSEAVLEDSWRQCMQAGLWPTLACAKAFSATDFRSELPAFRVPTLIIHGTGDKTVPIEASARPAAKGIAASRLIEYEDGPHGLFASHTKRLVGDLLSHLKG